MENNTVPFGILIVNILIIMVMIFLFYFNFRKCFVVDIPKKDHVFYSLKLKQSVTFFLANLVAFYVNYMLFFRYKIFVPEELTWLRYIDRVTMFIVSLLFLLDSLRYNPSSYDK